MQQTVKTSTDGQSVLLNIASAIIATQKCPQESRITVSTPKQKKKLIIPSAPRRVKKSITICPENLKSVRRVLCFDDFEVVPKEEVRGD
ncbi:hypothetical protein AKO1_011841 [Acrasis kona]|uniref:Uncharacterized protein n=1 Tax=Acrasis kona TaxID=1008807 RepID=A0AAW2Z7Z9_9EUKA